MGPREHVFTLVKHQHGELQLEAMVPQGLQNQMRGKKKKKTKLIQSSPTGLHTVGHVLLIRVHQHSQARQEMSPRRESCQELEKAELEARAQHTPEGFGQETSSLRGNPKSRG